MTALEVVALTVALAVVLSVAAWHVGARAGRSAGRRTAAWLNDMAARSATSDPGMLTEAEHEAVSAISGAWGAVCAVIGDGPTRDNDIHEVVVHIHALQNMVLAQAAARAYPDRYRLMGESHARDTATPSAALR